jgi:ParB-like chromosome segregation protein Spo0J
VLQPLLVRTIEEDKYEVVAGARRLRAAKLAALETVPVRVVELSDAACAEALKLRPGTATNAPALSRLIDAAYSDIKTRVEYG